MCLVALASDPDASQPLVLAANRDEYHDRPAAPAAWWSDRPCVLGGRDGRAGGTWLGVSRGGRFAVVLNDGRRSHPPGAPSRGELVPGFLEADDAGAWLAALVRARARYAGFHLVAGDVDRVHYVGSLTPQPVALGRGIHVIDNDGPDSGTPRARRARSCLAGPLAAGDEGPALIAALGDRADPGPGTGDRRPLFIADGTFGTRCSTVVRLERGEQPTGRLVEHRYDPAGAETGASGFVWPLGPGAPNR